MPSPLISLLAAGILTAVTVWFFRPEHGLYWRWQRARESTERVLNEDALKHLHYCERHRQQPTLQSLAGAVHITVNQASELLSKMETRDLVSLEAGDIALTPAGREYALRVIRAHRLWERYLADASGFDEAEWHERAEKYEHHLTSTEVDLLSARLGNPTHDPHGDPIPTATGEMVPHGGEPLSTFPVNQLARIVHIEDEPEIVYAQIAAEGLRPGMLVRVTEITPQRVHFWSGENEHTLAPIVAANLSVVALPEEDKEADLEGEPLSSLHIGETARIVSLSHRFRRVERRRMMDLGVLPGTLITAEMASAGGDPVAYRIRSALVALRVEQARLIRVQQVETGNKKELPELESSSQ